MASTAGLRRCIFTSSIRLVLAHDPDSVPEGTHTPELDAGRSGACGGRECHHRAEFRGWKADPRATRADADGTCAGRRGRAVYVGGRGSAGCVINAVDVAFQRIAAPNKFRINDHPSRDIPPTSNLKPRPRGAFLREESYPRIGGSGVRAISSSVRIDAYQQPGDSTGHQDDRGPLGNFVHSHPSLRRRNL